MTRAKQRTRTQYMVAPNLKRRRIAVAVAPPVGGLTISAAVALAHSLIVAAFTVEHAPRKSRRRS